MRNLNRQNAIRDISTSKSPIVPDSVQAGIADYGCDVFNAEVMRDYLPKETCSKLLQTIEKGKPLNPAIAGDVAHAMKHWALDRGATHFTHWFLPLNGSTAEKHDSFRIINHFLQTFYLVHTRSPLFPLKSIIFISFQIFPYKKIVFHYHIAMCRIFFWN